MLGAMVVFDMVLLAVEIWFSATWLLVTAALCIVFAAIRALLGTSWMVHTALAITGLSVVFILSQAGQSAWGANLMLYLLPIQIANVTAVAGAMLISLVWGLRV